MEQLMNVLAHLSSVSECWHIGGKYDSGHGLRMFSDRMSYGSGETSVRGFIFLRGNGCGCGTGSTVGNGITNHCIGCGRANGYIDGGGRSKR
jgi:hypothetical protein